MLKEFDKVAGGMEKDDVLDMMGSPTATLRRSGKDRWFYVFYEDKIRFEKEVQFFEGKVVYKGEPWLPPADQQAFAVDQKNEAMNSADRKRLEKDYQEYQDKAHVDQTKKVKYLPTFESIQ